MADSKPVRPDWVRLNRRGPCAPDWDFWGRSAAAPVWRWVAVGFRVEPQSLYRDSEYSVTFYGRGERFQKFLNTIDLAVAAIRARQIEPLAYAAEPDEWEQVSALEFWAWWISNEWAVPVEMREGLGRQAKRELAARGTKADAASTTATTKPAKDAPVEFVSGWKAVVEVLSLETKRAIHERTARDWLAAAGVVAERKAGRCRFSKTEVLRVARERQ